MSRKLALLIANSVYDDTNLSRLMTPEADVDALARVLLDPDIGGFDVADTFKNESTRTIMVVIARFFAKKKRDELLLLYFSGHGILDSRGSLYLAGRDTDHESINATAIPSIYINERMVESSSKQKVLILDCCYSGAFPRGTKGQAGKAVNTKNRFNGQGQVVLTATDATQYAWEGDAVIGEAQSSVFTRHLVQGLETGEADSDNDGWITLDEWYDYVFDQVRNETLKQTPGKWGKQQGRLPPIAKSRLPRTMDWMGIDLTAHGTLKRNPIIGRHQEMMRVIQILSQRKKNNPVLIGEPGVGKTAIVEGLAQYLVAGGVPEPLAGKRLLMLEIGSLVADTRERGEFEEHLKKIFEEIRKRGDCILCLDNLPGLFSADTIERVGDAAQIFKLALSRGELQCLGTSTPEAYESMIKHDKSLQAWFEEVWVGEMTIEETMEVLKSIREEYEQHHRVLLIDEALQAAAKLASRYIFDRPLPSKAFPLLDEAASQVRLQHNLMTPVNLKEAMKGLESVLREKEAAIQLQEYEFADELGDRAEKLRDRISKLESGWYKEFNNDRPIVDEEDIVKLVSVRTGLPLKRSAMARLSHMEEVLHERVIGQDRPVEIISQFVRRALGHARTGLDDPNRPISSFLFTGPSGVGKTELAKALTEFLFGSEDRLIKISIPKRLPVGTSSSSAVSEVSNQLIEAGRRKLASVILLDKIEYAYPSIFTLLVQILKDGKLIDAQGRTANFRNSIIILTSNVGAKLLNPEVPIDFKQSTSKVLHELKNTFTPEFLDHIDDVIVFHFLSMEDMYQIIDLLLNRIQQEQQIELVVPQATKDFLIGEGFDPQSGAHTLHSTIEHMVSNPLTEGLLEDKFHPGDLIETVVIDDELELRVRKRIEQFPPETPP